MTPLDRTLQLRMQLHQDGARVNLSATVNARATASITRHKLCAARSDGCLACGYCFSPWVPCNYVSASLSHRTGQGCFCFCFCSCRCPGPGLLESAVCSYRPQFGIHFFCFLFPVSRSLICAGQAELAPSYSPVVSAGPSATTACMAQLSYCDPRRAIAMTNP